MEQFNCKETGRPLIVVLYEYWKDMEERVKSAREIIKKAATVIGDVESSGGD